MANEYEMLFKLNAKLGGQFSGTFTKAQKALLDTQRKIQELAKRQADISAYTKQQNAIETTTKKLDLLAKQHDNIQQELQETGNSSSALKNKLLDKEAVIEKTNQALRREKEKLDELKQALQSAGVNTDKLEEESKELTKQLEAQEAEYKKNAENAELFGDKGANAFEAVGGALEAAGIAAALKKIAEQYKECVRISMEFEATMSTVEALSGANAGEMAQLTSKAKELGATTKFTATESGEAMTYMGMAGWDAQQMLSGMNGVLSLAAAAGEDLALVSDIVTDNLTAFGLKASDTAHFADVLAAAATNSNTTVGIMGETFKNCAPQAGALGYTIEDVAVAVGLMANAGIKGSLAGTALKNIFNGMINDISLTSAAFGEVTYSAVNADGTMKSFGETLNDLRGYFNQMTGAEKMQNAQALVGERAMAGFVALMNSAGDDVASLTQNINDCTGAAEKMAKIKMDNLQGQVTLLNSATDALKTTVGEAFAPELKKLAEIATKILTDINDFLTKHPTMLKAILAITGAATAALGVYLAYKAAKIAIIALKKLNAVLTAKETAATIAHTGAVVAETAATTAATAAQNGLNAAMMANPVGLIIAGIAALGIAIAGAYDEAKRTHEEIMQAVSEYNAAVKELNETYGETVGKAQIRADEAQKYIEQLKALEAQGVKTAEQQEEYAGILEKLRAVMPDINFEIDKQTGLLKDGAQALEEQIKAWKEQIKLQAIESLLKGKIEARIQLQYDRGQTETALEAAQAKLDEINARPVGEKYSGNTFYDVLGSDLGKAEREVFNLKNKLKEEDAALIASQTEIDAMTAAYEKAADEISLFTDKTEEAADAAGNTSDAIESVQERLEKLKEEYYAAKEAALQSIEGQYDLWDTAAIVVPKSIGTINTALETQTSYWSDYNTDLSALLGKAGQIEGLGEMVASFADGSADSVNVIAGMASASDSDLKKMVANWKAVKEQQDLAAGSLADYRVGFTGELEGVQSDIEGAIEGLDLSDAAERAATDTMDAYMRALQSGALGVESILRNLARMASAALNGDIENWGSGGGVGGGRETTVMQYAGGTDYAAPGWAVVGEVGPELIYMHGGEQVLPAEKTEAVLRSGAQVTLTVAPVFDIKSGEDISEILLQCTEDIKANVIDALEEAGIDADRRRYA